jgi:hypothetical protein
VTSFRLLAGRRTADGDGFDAVAAEQVPAMMFFDEFVDGLSHVCRQNQVGNRSFGLSLMEQRRGCIAACEHRDVGTRGGSSPGQRIGQLGGQHPMLLALLLRDQRLRSTTEGQLITSCPGLDEGKPQAARAISPPSVGQLAGTIVADAGKTSRQRTAAGH